jgi:hypothetical protein
MWPRDLLADERHFLDVMLSRSFEGRHELRAQADAVTATGPSCTCGCPSIALAVDRNVPPAPVHGMVAEGIGVDANGNYVGVLLFVDDQGYMNDLDVYAFGGDIHGQPTYTHGKPTIDSFELPEWERDSDGMNGTPMNLPKTGRPDGT